MKRTLSLVLLGILASAFIGCGPSSELSIRDRRQVVQDMRRETLDRLYAEAPYTKQRIKEAAGYAVFSNGNVSVVFVTGGGGYGVARNLKKNQDTYMKMGMGGVGLGLGAKDYRLVLIFNSAEAMNHFIESGWEFGGVADAVAQAGEQGGAASSEGNFKRDVEVFTLTESGLLLQANLTGTKFWQDPDLNTTRVKPLPIPKTE